MAAGEAINCEKRYSSPVPGETFSHVGSDTACPEQLPTLPPFLEDFRTPLDTVLSKLGLNSEPTLLRVPFSLSYILCDPLMTTEQSAFCLIQLLEGRRGVCSWLRPPAAPPCAWPLNGIVRYIFSWLKSRLHIIFLHIKA